MGGAFADDVSEPQDDAPQSERGAKGRDQRFRSHLARAVKTDGQRRPKPSCVTVVPTSPYTVPELERQCAAPGCAAWLRGRCKWQWFPVLDRAACCQFPSGRPDSPPDGKPDQRLENAARILGNPAGQGHDLELWLAGMWARCSRRPEEKLSKTLTSRMVGSASRASNRWEPIKPAPPVTRYVNEDFAP